MSDEEIIEWLGRWGKDAVGYQHIVASGILDKRLSMSGAHLSGGFTTWLDNGEVEVVVNKGYKLTQKAIDKLKGNENG